MATGTMDLSPGSADLPDGTGSNLAPAIQRVKISGSAPVGYPRQLVFDAAQREQVSWTRRVPANFASGPTIVVQFKMASATAGVVVFEARVAAVTPGDSTDVDAKALGAANSVTTATVPGTAGYLAEVQITLTNADSMAAGDFVIFYLARDGANGSDTATGDCEVTSITFLYTTT